MADFFSFGPSLRPCLAGALLAALLTSPATAVPETPTKPTPPGTMDVQPLSGPAVRVRLKGAKLTLVTPYGTLLIPITDIQRIDFATRISDEEARRIAKAVADLGSHQYRARQAASTLLLRMAEKAYSALHEARKSPDVEVRRRATELLDRLEQQLSDELAPVRSSDVVYTKESKIAGRILTSELEGRTPKGRLRLRVADLRTLVLAEADDIDISKAIPDPGNLVNYQNQTKKTFVFKVTGRATGGFVWGTDLYTTDSTLAMAVVHAG